MSNLTKNDKKPTYRIPERRIGRKPNWRGIKVSLGSEKLFDATGTPLPGVKIHGAITGNHASTITQKKKYVDENGETKYYDQVVGSTHELPTKTQSLLATILSNPKTEKNKAIYLYDQKTEEWQNNKETGISYLVDIETGDVLKTVDHNKKESN